MNNQPNHSADLFTNASRHNFQQPVQISQRADQLEQQIPYTNLVSQAPVQNQIVQQQFADVNARQQYSNFYPYSPIQFSTAASGQSSVMRNQQPLFNQLQAINPVVPLRQRKLPKKGDPLIDFDGYVNVSMRTQLTNNRVEEEVDFPHTYLAGVIQCEPKKLRENFSNDEKLSELYLETYPKIFNSDPMRPIYTKSAPISLNQWLPYCTKNQTKIIKEMTFMAHHMVFYCGEHMRNYSQSKITFKHYLPQTQARHTVREQFLVEKKWLEENMRYVEKFKPTTPGITKLITENLEFIKTLRQQDKIDSSIQTFSDARISRNNANPPLSEDETGHPLLDEKCPQYAYSENKKNSTCDSFYDQNLNALRDTINFSLPILDNDVDFLAGAHLSVASLHEALIHCKKRLAVEHYSKLAQRMTTPLCFPLFAMTDVQLAAAGDFEVINNNIKITQLVGPVKLIPVFKAVPCGQKKDIEDLFVYTLPAAMNNMIERIKTLEDETKTKHYSESGWPCELVFLSSDENAASLRVITNIMVKKNILNIRDPQMSVQVMPLNFVLNTVSGKPFADWLTVAKAEPSKQPHPSTTKKNKEKKARVEPKPVQVQPNHLKSDDKRYARLISGRVRSRAGILGTKKMTKQWVVENSEKGSVLRFATAKKKEKNLDMLHQNLTQLLINNVSWQTFGEVPTSADTSKQEVFKKLQKYRLHEVVIGMVCKETVTNMNTGKALGESLLRQVFCSNELGLHWARLDKERKPFQWLQVAENEQFTEVNWNAKVVNEVPPALEGLILLGDEDVEMKELQRYIQFAKTSRATKNQIVAQSSFVNELLILDTIEGREKFRARQDEFDQALKFGQIMTSPAQLKTFYLRNFLKRAFQLLFYHLGADWLVDRHLETVLKENRLFAMYYDHLPRSNAHRNLYLPAWPQLWMRRDIFKSITETIFLRFNYRELNEQDYRVIALDNEEEENAFILEVARCIIGYCAFNKCTFTPYNYTVIFSNKLVVQNFLMALTCKVADEKALAQRLRDFQGLTQLLKESNVNAYLLSHEKPEWKENCDLFANDAGFRFLTQAVGDSLQNMAKDNVVRNFYARDAKEPIWTTQPASHELPKFPQLLSGENVLKEIEQRDSDMWDANAGQRALLYNQVNQQKHEEKKEKPSQSEDEEMKSVSSESAEHEQEESPSETESEEEAANNDEEKIAEVQGEDDYQSQ